MSISKALLSSTKMDWCTPQKFFDELDHEFHFVVDVAASEKSKKTKFYFTPESDGLKNSWDFGGTVFCNPPYGKDIKKWIQKAFDESKKGVRIVLLIPARTDTNYFHEFIYGKAQIRFLRGRMKFTDENGSELGRAQFPSMLVIYN